MLEGLFGPPGRPRGDAGTLEQLRALKRVLGELGRLLEVVLRLLARRERGRALASAREHLAGPRADLGGVGGIGRGAVRVEVVRRDDLDHLLLALAPRPLEVPRRGEVPELPVGA